MTQAEFASQWQEVIGKDFGIPACPEGMLLLKFFAERYPMLFELTRQEDLIYLDSNLFLFGAPEWGFFTEHVIGCSRCNEV